MAHDTDALVGQEARAKGFTVQLAGGANLVREPRGGRNFEYVYEDPLADSSESSSHPAPRSAWISK